MVTDEQVRLLMDGINGVLRGWRQYFGYA